MQTKNRIYFCMRRNDRSFGSRKNREINKENLFVVGAIVLSFVVTLGLSFIFSGKGFLGLAGVFDKEQMRTIYAIAVGGYEDMTIARSSAELIRSRGGAGYVTKSDDESLNNIEIIYAVYSDKSAAEQVLGALDDRSAYVKEIATNVSTYSWCEGDVKAAVKEAMAYFNIAFDGMYTVSNSLNDNNMTVSDAKTKIRVLYEHIDDIKSVFYQKVQRQDKSQITEIKLALITALALLEGIEYGSQAETCASIRYNLVQLVLCYKALMQAV